ncbi:protein PTST, chloroplastic isoform X2 [Cannabis sativa]|uniref:protein PTST, chloroplastic isoform X2 n=2 Tax=Cannabis sativa TaxID=3483 RepID=UPI0029CA798F|nr:protein PTST, chloroplastic isoform X2 [Cannabis sativa]
MEVGSTRCCLVKQAPCFSRNTRTFCKEKFHHLPYNMASCNLKMGHQRLNESQARHHLSYVCQRLYCMPINVEESSSLESEFSPNDEESTSKDSPEEFLAQPISSNALKALLADSERANLLRKLSEANQQNRFLKRQLHVKEEALVEFKSELAVIELEIQALVKLAEEIAKSGIPKGSRKINGKYIQSHLLSRLEAVLEKLEEQVKDIGAAQCKEVPLFWYGMAESVQVMGSFDGWSQGEYLSSEYTGSYTKFSTTLMLRPGKYEIKFLVDGEWKLSPEYPIVGEGLMINNLLTVQ